MTNTAVLQFPSSYVLMNSEEMTYVDGGFRMARNTAAILIDVTAIIISAGLASSAKVGQFAAKIGWTKLKEKAAGAILKLGISQVWANAAVNIIKTVTNFSIGFGIAWILDKTDKSGLNEWIEY